MFLTIDDYCFRAKNLYNYANYLTRQEFINNGKWIRSNNLDKMLQSHETYKKLGSQAAQKILQLLDKNWSSFFKTIKDWSKNKNKYLGRPRLPKYKDKNGRSVLMLKNIQCRIKEGYLIFGWKPFRNFKIKTNVVDKLMQVRFVPKGNHYVMEIVYEKEICEPKNQNKIVIGIDLGIDNFATISNNIGLEPLVINGKGIKSVNQYFNKKKSQLQSALKTKHNKNWSNKIQKLINKRNNKINYFLHCASRYIIDWCILNEVDTIIIGRNKKWKQKSVMSKKVNQKFISIPHELFIQKLKYKAENHGINFIETEESYTSGTSFLDNEKPIKENYNKKRRTKRGLFKSNNGILINADLNGAYQIIKKVFPNAFVEGIEGVGLHPVRVNL